MKRRVFKDAALQQNFIKTGYNTVNLLQPEQVQYILNAMQDLHPSDEFLPSGEETDDLMDRVTYHCSFLDTNTEYKRQVHNLVREVFDQYVEKFLAGYRIVNANFYVKPPHQGKFAIHQNWPILDDLTDTSVTIWCPLQDTCVENGTLHVVKGSHKVYPHIEGVTLPSYFKGFEQALHDRWLTPLDVLAGDAVIFDDGLIHWTAFNHSDAPRIALQILCVPVDKQPVFFYHDPKNNPDELELFQADVDFFIDNHISDLLVRKSDWESLGFVKNTNRLITEEEFADLMTRGDEIRAELYD